jgi:hypothetical protein
MACGGGGGVDDVGVGDCGGGVGLTTTVVEVGGGSMFFLLFFTFVCRAWTHGNVCFFAKRQRTSEPFPCRLPSQSLSPFFMRWEQMHFVCHAPQ